MHEMKTLKRIPVAAFAPRLGMRRMVIGSRFPPLTFRLLSVVRGGASERLRTGPPVVTAAHFDFNTPSSHWNAASCISTLKTCSTSQTRVSS